MDVWPVTAERPAERERGLNADDASQLRFRPILMTTMCALLGGTGFRCEFIDPVPQGVVLVTGMTATVQVDQNLPNQKWIGSPRWSLSSPGFHGKRQADQHQSALAFAPLSFRGSAEVSSPLN